MLKVGEYAELLNQIQDLCGFDLEDVDDLREEVKN
jgi:Phage XkdN-like protein.